MYLIINKCNTCQSFKILWPQPFNFGYRCFGLYRNTLTYGAPSRSLADSSWDTLYIQSLSKFTHFFCHGIGATNLAECKFFEASEGNNGHEGVFAYPVLTSGLLSSPSAAQEKMDSTDNYAQITRIMLKHFIDHFLTPDTGLTMTCICSTVYYVLASLRMEC
jgi:hypothetical protein